MNVMPSTWERDYRMQIDRCARALAVADNLKVAGDLAVGFSLAQVKMFTDGNLDKRYQKVLDQVELLEDTFDDLDDLVAEYVKTVPLAAYDTGCSDGERFLRWVEETAGPTPEQQDVIACQQSRHAVEAEARRNRIGYLRFQELRSMASELAEDLETNSSLTVHLNPVRVWSTLQTRVLLDEDAETPASVLFYPAEGDIRTALLELPGQELVRELAAVPACRIEEWTARRGRGNDDRAMLVEFCRDAAAIGLVAFS